MSLLFALAAAAALPSSEDCAGVAADPDAAYAYAVGLQGYVYGYPMVDLLKQKHNETHRIAADPPVLGAVNTIAVYPHILTPVTQGQLRAANADTLYLNAWLDLSHGPVLIDAPATGKRYYTLAFMDLYGVPRHVGTRFNGDHATRYALIGPSEGEAPSGYEPVHVATDTVWMLGRLLVDGPKDEPAAIAPANRFVMRGPDAAEPVAATERLNPYDSLAFFDLLNRALHSVPRIAGEAGLMAVFDNAGFGPGVELDVAQFAPAARRGLGCALAVGPKMLARQGFKPTRAANGWLYSSELGRFGNNCLLRAESARGGYVNDPEESIYPAAIADSAGRPLDAANRYRIVFPAGQTPPVGTFWSITACDAKTLQLVENPIGRYQFGDRTSGARRGRDGSLTIELSHDRPAAGTANWLPVPRGAVMLVARLYLPAPEALDGRYLLPPVERIAP